MQPFTLIPGIFKGLPVPLKGVLGGAISIICYTLPVRAFICLNACELRVDKHRTFVCK